MHAWVMRRLPPKSFSITNPANFASTSSDPMDPPAKKRLADDDGAAVIGGPASSIALSTLTREDAGKMAEPLSRRQLLGILQNAAVRHPDVLERVRAIADRDKTRRKLFVRGLGWDTTADGLRAAFSAFGDLEEAVVVLDKSTGKSKGYGFVTFRHVDSALLALKEPNKVIDGRATAAQLAVARAGMQPTGYAPTRMIYVENVPVDMPPEELRLAMAAYGEIERGPIGYDKKTGKSRGYALFVYKTLEAARASLIHPLKNVAANLLICKPARSNGDPALARNPDGIPPNLPLQVAKFARQSGMKWKDGVWIVPGRGALPLHGVRAVPKAVTSAVPPY